MPPPLISSSPQIQPSFSQIVLTVPSTQYFPLPFAPKLLQPYKTAFGVLLKLKADSEPGLWTNPGKPTRKRAFIMSGWEI